MAKVTVQHILETELENLFRGDEILEETTQDLTLTDLSLLSEDIISCSAVNIVGQGMSDSFQFEVSGIQQLFSTLQLTFFTAPPAFITKLAEKTKFVSSSSELSLMCQVSRTCCHFFLTNFIVIQG